MHFINVCIMLIITITNNYRILDRDSQEQIVHYISVVKTTSIGQVTGSKHDDGIQSVPIVTYKGNKSVTFF